MSHHSLDGKRSFSAGKRVRVSIASTRDRSRAHLVSSSRRANSIIHDHTRLHEQSLLLAYVCQSQAHVVPLLVTQSDPAHLVGASLARRSGPPCSPCLRRALTPSQPAEQHCVRPVHPVSGDRVEPRHAHIRLRPWVRHRVPITLTSSPSVFPDQPSGKSRDTNRLSPTLRTQPPSTESKPRCSSLSA